MHKTVIKNYGHLRTLKKCRKHRLVFYTFPSCSEMHVVLYHSLKHGLGFFICSVIMCQIYTAPFHVQMFKCALQACTKFTVENLDSRLNWYRALQACTKLTVENLDSRLNWYRALQIGRAHV